MHPRLAKLKQKALDHPLADPVRQAGYILNTLAGDISRYELMKHASAMTYITLLSLVPFLVAVFLVVSLFSPLIGEGGSLVAKLQGFVLQHLTPGTGEEVIGYLNSLISSLDAASIGWSTFASVLVSTILLLRNIEEALNRIWLVRKARNAFSRFMYFWTFLTLGMAVLAVLIGAWSGFDLKGLLGPESLNSKNEFVSRFVAWAGGFLFFFLAYKIVPNCFVSMKEAAVGALFASVCLQQGGRLYGFWVQDAANYKTLYGTLAQLPIFLLWIFICWAIILLGAVLAWRMQQGFPHEEKEDTLDAARSPVENFRNVQVKAVLPMICLLTIYENFEAGRGRGLTEQELTQRLKLPLSWIEEALETLETMGYIVATRTPESSEDEGSVFDAYLPTYPPHTLKVETMRQDLEKPIQEWMTHWHHDFPYDLTAAVRRFTGREDSQLEKLSLAQALKNIPQTSPASSG